MFTNEKTEKFMLEFNKKLQKNKISVAYGFDCFKVRDYVKMCNESGKYENPIKYTERHYKCIAEMKK